MIQSAQLEYVFVQRYIMAVDNLTDGIRNYCGFKHCYSMTKRVFNYLGNRKKRMPQKHSAYIEPIIDASQRNLQIF